MIDNYKFVLIRSNSFNFCLKKRNAARRFPNNLTIIIVKKSETPQGVSHKFTFKITDD